MIPCSVFREWCDILKTKKTKKHVKIRFITISDHKNNILVQNQKKISVSTDPTRVSQPSKKEAILHDTKKNFHDEITSE